MPPRRRQAVSGEKVGMSRDEVTCTQIMSSRRKVTICNSLARWLGIMVWLAAPVVHAQIVTVSISAPDASASESPPDNARFEVSRVGGSMSVPVTVNYTASGSATLGADYTALTGTVTLGIFQQEASIPLNVTGDDGLFEGDESVTVTLIGSASVAVQDASATVTIADSPHAVTVTSGSNATEAPVQAGQVIVSLGAVNQSGQALTVNYTVAGTATPGTDYAPLSGSAVIATGAGSAAIDVSPIDDDDVEGDETVEVTLTATSDSRVALGDPKSADLTIEDDEAVADDDGDGLINIDECPDVTDCRDTDQDGTPDWQDADDDGDGVPTASENAPDQDTDSDTTPDYLDDNDDDDGRLTREEDANEDGDGNPATDPTDLDDDGIPDYLDAEDQGGPTGDLDGDGLTNEREEEIGTDPTVADTDGDGVDDGDEDAAGTDPLDNASFADADGDLVPDSVEAADGTDPNDATRFLDSDDGGTADHIETITYENNGIPASNVLDGQDDHRDFDGDGLPDRVEIASGSAPDSSESPTANGAGDDNGNGVSNAVEAYLAGIGVPGVDATSDFDRDGYPDAMEVAFALNPVDATAGDNDADSVPDVVEIAAGADIDASTDSDADGVPDAREIAFGSDPLDANSPEANGSLDDDGDGVSNAIEEILRMLGADDVDASTDSDSDGLVDVDEIRFGTDPMHDEQPIPWITLIQADFGPVRALGSSGGEATATAVIGGHQSGTLSYDWSASDNAVLAVASGGQTRKSLTFEPATLPSGHYTLVLRVQRTVGSFSSPDSVVQLTLEVLPGAEAGDLADADNDGVPDAADDTDGRRGFANILPAQGGAQMMANTGARLRLGSTARATRSNSASVTRNDIAAAGDGQGEGVTNSEDEFDYLSGIYDFEVTDLPEVGAVAQIVIPQAAPLGELPEYRKFLPGSGWRNFVVDANNTVSSAPSVGGECPESGNDAYHPGLTMGHSCIQLTIEDGGPNDGDAEAGPNGVVRDPGGVGTPKGRVSVGQGGGDTGPLAIAALALLALWSGLRRKRAAIATTCVALLCTLAFVPAARADTFLGLGAGLSKLDPDTAGTPFSVTDDQDAGFKAFGGIDLTPISPLLSAEVFWADLGQATLEDRGNVDYTAYGAGLSLGVSSTNAPRFSAFVKGGIAQLDISADIPVSQDKDTSLYLGVAGSYAVRRNWYLQLEYDYFAQDAQFLSLSIVKRFRVGQGSKAKTIPLPDSRNDARGTDLD